MIASGGILALRGSFRLDSPYAPCKAPLTDPLQMLLHFAQAGAELRGDMEQGIPLPKQKHHENAHIS
jgi:hypothetical protein